jgi:type II secretory pathway component PulF
MDLGTQDKSDFCRSVGVVMQAGVRLEAALRIAGQAAEHARVTQAAESLCGNLNQDSLISDQFLENCPDFNDGLFKGFVQVGEQTGELSKALLTLSTCTKGVRSRGGAYLREGSP